MFLKFITAFINKFWPTPVTCDKENTSRTTQKLHNDKFSYILLHKRLSFEDDYYSFDLEYMCDKRKNIWFVAENLTNALQICERTLHNCVTRENLKSLEQILFDRCDDTRGSTKVMRCLNKSGAMQLFNAISFDKKCDFVVWFMNVLDNLESSKMNDCDLKVYEIHQMITILFKNFNALCVSHDEKNAETFAKLIDLECKILNIQQHLNNYSHAQQILDVNNKLLRFPLDTTKHPSLGVYVKTKDDKNTIITFVSGQQKHFNSRKRKMDSADLMCNIKHPNPRLAINCLYESLTQNYKCMRKNNSTVFIEAPANDVSDLIKKNLTLKHKYL
ncbi:387 kDa [Urbanus proteus nucleopolyhedrovirus]|uniref:387 kDa n=1 Tax=Urbanus proteus nucleopolyhedrovirus TaxID=1675866 RepID=A0A161C6X1_9ABAC|nr:387 kDa [Urbanus proteus nucleopolyhedrovirus]AKR17332.1 387 kDa [Urbanus proteus nucleopolyhedrovirus]